MLAGTEGSQLAPGLLPEPAAVLESEVLLAGEIQKISDREVVIYKPRWGAFFNTPLEAHLKKENVNTLVFCGCNFPNCPRTSIYEASERDFKIVLASDALSGLYARGEREMQNIGVRLLETDEIVRLMGG